MTTTSPSVRPEDVEVIVCSCLLAQLLGTEHDLTYEEQGWILLVWCSMHDAVFYDAPLATFDIEAARALAASKGRSQVVVDILL